MAAGDRVRVTIETPRGGFVKWRADGGVDYVSPLPCPFNYGAIAEALGGDGDPLDAVVLGPRLPAGATVAVDVFGVVRFVDAGQVDDKLVCGDRAPSRAERALVLGFFAAYARAKGLLNRARGKPGPTRLVGWVLAAALSLAIAASTARAAEPWVDPAFAAADWPADCPDGDDGPVLATAWFERQLLTGPGAYAARTAQWAASPRRSLRPSVVAELRAHSAASAALAGPVLGTLDEQGVVRGCRRHWIVNAVTCELPTGDPAPLAGVPGVTRVFRRPPRCGGDGPELGPRQVATTMPAAGPAEPAPPTWNLEQLRIPEVWRRGFTGKGVLVAIHDFGFRLDVPAIAGTLWRNPGEVPGNGVDDEGDGYVDDVHGFAFDRGDDSVNRPRPKADRPIHGNAVAAIVAGRPALGSEEALGGAPDARWVAITADGAIEEALEWAILHDVDVYSMSFSIPDLGTFRAHWRRACEQAALAGLFLVSGAGNFGEEGSPEFQPVPVQMRVPEDIPLAVFGVVGVGPSGVRPPFSSRGPVSWDLDDYREGLVDKPDLSTVNQGVPALGADGRIMARPGGGNSYAGPHLAAVLALLLEADPDLTPWVARDVLVATAHDLGAPGFDPEYGAGLVDAARALREVRRRR